MILAPLLCTVSKVRQVRHWHIAKIVIASEPMTDPTPKQDIELENLAEAWCHNFGGHTPRFDPMLCRRVHADQ